MIGSSEHNEQVGIISWFRQRYPGTLIFSIPNGGVRHIHTAITLAREGVVPGVPDLYVPKWNLWIEMKKEHGGVLSAHQHKIIAYLRDECKHEVIIGKGARDASAQILEFAKRNKYE